MSTLADITAETWEVITAGDIASVDDRGILLADVCCMYFPDDTTSERRAHLIAAAPALYRALKNLLDEAQPLGIDRPSYQAAIAALNAAEGTES